MRSLRNRKVVLLSLDWGRPKDPPFSLGAASIFANLRAHGVDVIHKSVAVNMAGFRIEDLFPFIREHAEEGTDFALGAYVWNELHVQEILNFKKREKLLGRVIVGGPQASYVKKNIESYYPQADVFIRGYAEEALAELMISEEEQPVIRGVHYAGKPDAGLSAIADLEKLPSPFLTGVIPAQHFIRWETQRGCPFRCTFCQHRESDMSMTRRHFSKTRIGQEIHWIVDNPIIQDVAVLDPTFNAGPHYLNTIKEFISCDYRGKLALQCRAEMIKEEFLDLVQTLNATAHVVLEIGLQTIHRSEGKAIERINQMKQVAWVFQETKRRRISTEVSLIFGLPEQTIASFQASIDFCKTYGVPVIYAYPLMLLRGTPLADQKDKYGLIESTDINVNVDRIQQYIPHVVSSNTFTFEDWKVMAKMAESLDEYNRDQKMRNTLRPIFFASSAPTSQNQSNSPQNEYERVVLTTR